MDAKTAERSQPEQHKPRVLWVGNLRSTGGITVITKRFLGDSQVHQRYNVRVQDPSFPGRWNAFLPLQLLKIPRGVLAIIWNMLTFRPDIVHIHTSYQLGFLRDGLVALIAKAFGAKVALTFHSGWTLQEDYLEEPTWLRWLTRRVMPRVDAVVANGPSYEAFFRSEFNHTNIHILQNPVTDEDVPAYKDDYLSRDRIVFFAGLLERRKGVLELLKAAEKVPDARFIIYGQTLRPGDKAAFEDAFDACAAKDRIQLDVGWGVGKVFEYMQQARLLALPSWGESLPLVMEEALVCGLPVVTTPVGVIADYIEDGVHGCLIEPGDADALAEAIRRTLDDEAWALEVSKRNRVFGRQFLSSAVHAKLFAMYDQLAGCEA